MNSYFNTDIFQLSILMFSFKTNLLFLSNSSYDKLYFLKIELIFRNIKELYTILFLKTLGTKNHREKFLQL